MKSAQIVDITKHHTGWVVARVGDRVIVHDGQAQATNAPGGVEYVSSGLWLNNPEDMGDETTDIVVRWVPLDDWDGVDESIACDWDDINRISTR